MISCMIKIIWYHIWYHIVQGSRCFFTWLFTKMAVSMVGGWESGLELAGNPLVLNNAWIGFRTSFSWGGNNPSADALVLWKSEKVPPDVRFYWWTFSAILMRHDLHVEDRSYLPWNEAYKYSVSLISFVINALLGRHAQWATLFLRIFIKHRFCSKFFVSNLFHAAWIQNLTYLSSEIPHLVQVSSFMCL